MNEVVKMFRCIENEPYLILANKKVDYLFHYWLGRYEKESVDRGILFYSGLAEWIYQYLLNEGYQMTFSYCWYKMIYSVVDNQEEAWRLFFECVYKYVEECGKKQRDGVRKIEQRKKVTVKKLVDLIDGRPGIATGEKRIDYVSHYFAGIYTEEDKMYDEISQWIYNWLRKRGYNLKWSKWWHELIYQITIDEEEAWEMLFRSLREYFDSVLS